MPAQIAQNSQMGCEKSPGTWPFFPAAPECGPMAFNGESCFMPHPRTCLVPQDFF
jgi:hypothetical protein